MGIVAGILLIVAGIQLNSHGQNLVDLRSSATQSGDSGTIMEAYYNETGYSVKAYALAAYGMGASVITIAVGLGASLMKKSP